MENKLEFTKMQERVDWALNELKKEKEAFDLDVSDETLFIQACEMARTLFVRSEIAYSTKKQ